MRLAPNLPVPESGAPCPHCGAATGGHGTDPALTVHTCTEPGDSPAMVSGQNRKQEIERIEKNIASHIRKTARETSMSTFISSQNIKNWLNLHHAVKAQLCH
ncbi:hypothetical protein XENOCAPTIV_006777 [Xenoophorus captivus]|uniref:Uncharacterized protein n=2 Tax=Goodeidae TaxID=28758 RepID=A0ABV0RY31_9TELE